MRLRLDRVDEIGELHRILDEKDRDVVADQIEVAFLGVELHREAAHVARQVARPPRARHGREPHEDRGPLRRVLEEGGPGVPAQGALDLEIAVGGGAPGMDDPLRDPLVVEVGDLLPEDEVLQEGGPAGARLERVLVVEDAEALIGGEQLAFRILAELVERFLLRRAGRLAGRAIRLGLPARHAASPPSSPSSRPPLPRAASCPRPWRYAERCPAPPPGYASRGWRRSP